MADEMNTNAAAANAPMLRIADLHVYYGAIHALKGLSLEVKEGEIVTLIGANGAGKSTTLRTISGLIAPKSGTVAFEGRNIAGTGAHEIVRLGLSQVPEGRRIFAEMTVLENLELGAFIRSDKDGIADDMEMVFERFPRLKERRTQQAGTLSGGEQQMLAWGAPHEPPAAAAPRRAVDGPCAAPDQRDFLHYRGHQPGRHNHPARRAERKHGALDRKPRLRP